MHVSDCYSSIHSIYTYVVVRPFKSSIFPSKRPVTQLPVLEGWSFTRIFSILVSDKTGFRCEIRPLLLHELPENFFCLSFARSVNSHFSIFMVRWRCQRRFDICFIPSILFDQEFCVRYWCSDSCGGWRVNKSLTSNAPFLCC
jgi:hypothetical protein